MESKTGITEVRAQSNGRFVPGNPGGPGRPLGSRNKKTTQSARDVMAEKGIDPIAKLCEMLTNPQQGLENGEIIEINEILLKYSHVDPDKELPVIDVLPGITPPEGMLTKLNGQAELNGTSHS